MILIYHHIHSDMTEMDGGELEIIKMEKYAGMKALTEGSLKPEVGSMMMILLVTMIVKSKDEPSFQDIERISYEAPGKMMLAQVLHIASPHIGLSKTWMQHHSMRLRDHQKDKHRSSVM